VSNQQSAAAIWRHWGAIRSQNPEFGVIEEPGGSNQQSAAGIQNLV